MKSFDTFGVTELSTNLNILYINPTIYYGKYNFLVYDTWNRLIKIDDDWFFRDHNLYELSAMFYYNLSKIKFIKTESDDKGNVYDKYEIL